MSQNELETATQIEVAKAQGINLESDPNEALKILNQSTNQNESDSNENQNLNPNQLKNQNENNNDEDDDLESNHDEKLENKNNNLNQKNKYWELQKQLKKQEKQLYNLTLKNKLLINDDYEFNQAKSAIKYFIKTQNITEDEAIKLYKEKNKVNTNNNFNIGISNNFANNKNNDHQDLENLQAELAKRNIILK